MTKRNRRHGRRRTRRRGGVYYGKGAHKETIDVGFIENDVQTLFHKLDEKNKDITSIELHYINDNKKDIMTLSHENNQIADFIGALGQGNAFVASLFLTNVGRGFIQELFFEKLTPLQKLWLRWEH